MPPHESDLGVVCRLAHVHLGERAATKNSVLAKLPRDFHGIVDELARAVPTSLDVPAALRSSTTTLGVILQRIISYQAEKCHHQPPSRLERFTSNEGFHARRIVCELLKAWVLANHGADDDAVDPDEVECYEAWVTQLLYNYDRWSSKYWTSDAFLGILVSVKGKLAEMKMFAQRSRHSYARALERIYENMCELLDHALRVTLLAIADNHAEIEQVCQNDGTICMKLLSRACSRSGSSFWGTDFGQVIHTALVRGDPERFPPAGVRGDDLVSAPADLWTLWTHEIGSLRMYEYRSEGVARQEFDKNKYCAVLVSPDGMASDKNWTNNSMLSTVMKQVGAMSDLNARVDQFLSLQMAAISRCSAEADQDAASSGADDAAVGERICDWDIAVARIREKWMNSDVDFTGVAEPFRGGKLGRWVEGVVEKVNKAADFPSLILDVPKRLSDLLKCHVQVMGAVHTMISEGGSKEALAAIYALRQRSSITVHLARHIDLFIGSASLMHGFFQHELFKSIEQGRKIKGQLPSMQRMYLESYEACSAIRDSILTEWHKLGLTVTDRVLAEELQRIDLDEREAFARLMKLPAATSNAIGWEDDAANSIPQALTDTEGDLAAAPKEEAMDNCGDGGSPDVIRLLSQVGVGGVHCAEQKDETLTMEGFPGDSALDSGRGAEEADVLPSADSVPNGTAVDTSPGAEDEMQTVGELQGVAAADDRPSASVNDQLLTIDGSPSAADIDTCRGAEMENELLTADGLQSAAAPDVSRGAREKEQGLPSAAAADVLCSAIEKNELPTADGLQSAAGPGRGAEEKAETPIANVLPSAPTDACRGAEEEDDLPRADGLPSAAPSNVDRGAEDKGETLNADRLPTAAADVGCGAEEMDETPTQQLNDEEKAGLAAWATHIADHVRGPSAAAAQVPAEAAPPPEPPKRNLFSAVAATAGCARRMLNEMETAAPAPSPSIPTEEARPDRREKLLAAMAITATLARTSAVALANRVQESAEAAAKAQAFKDRAAGPGQTLQNSGPLGMQAPCAEDLQLPDLKDWLGAVRLGPESPRDAKCEPRAPSEGDATASLPDGI